MKKTLLAAAFALAALSLKAVHSPSVAIAKPTQTRLARGASPTYCPFW